MRTHSQRHTLAVRFIFKCSFVWRAHKRNRQQQTATTTATKSVKVEIVYINSSGCCCCCFPLKTPDSHFDRIQYTRDAYPEHTHSRIRNEIEIENYRQPKQLVCEFLMVKSCVSSHTRSAEANKKSQTNECAHKW